MMRRFSQEYYEIIEKAMIERGVSVPVNSAQEARNLRTYLYHFRKFLRDSNHPLADGAHSFKFIIHPHELEIQPKERAPADEALRKAI